MDSVRRVFAGWVAVRNWWKVYPRLFLHQPDFQCCSAAVFGLSVYLFMFMLRFGLFLGGRWGFFRFIFHWAADFPHTSNLTSVCNFVFLISADYIKTEPWITDNLAWTVYRVTHLSGSRKRYTRNQVNQMYHTFSVIDYFSPSAIHNKLWWLAKKMPASRTSKSGDMKYLQALFL